ncbi:hypothetical protein BD413DRAFT_215113 [Trametes elegans]|nr:hypothetical protein BD413DRAFT_215113 [Trametes elegans]
MSSLRLSSAIAQPADASPACPMFENVPARATTPAGLFHPHPHPALSAMSQTESVPMPLCASAVGAAAAAAPSSHGCFQPSRLYPWDPFSVSVCGSSAKLCWGCLVEQIGPLYVICTRKAIHSRNASTARACDVLQANVMRRVRELLLLSVRCCRGEKVAGLSRYECVAHGSE